MSPSTVGAHDVSFLHVRAVQLLGIRVRCCCLTHETQAGGVSGYVNMSCMSLCTNFHSKEYREELAALKHRFSGYVKQILLPTVIVVNER